MTKPFRNPLVVLALVLILLLAAGYSLTWELVARQWQRGIDAWIKAQAAAGWTITTGDIKTGGFPGPVRLTLGQPSARRADGLSWQGPAATLEIAPWLPEKPRFTAPGEHHFTPSGGAPIAITAEQLAGQVTVAQGKPVALAVTGQNLSGLGLALAGLNVELSRPAPDPKETVPTQVSALIGLDRLTLPDQINLPFDKMISGAHLALRWRGAIPAGPRADALAQWRDGGGTVEIDSFDLAWPPLALAGDATLALDKDLQPELAGTVVVQGGPATIDRAAKAGMIDKGGANVAKIALMLASKPVNDGTDAVKIAVAIQNRVLSVGPAPIWQVPPVTW